MYIHRIMKTLLNDFTDTETLLNVVLFTFIYILTRVVLIHMTCMS